MEDYQAIISVISLTMGVSWASGVNLYAALLMLGVAGATGSVDLPADLQTLENPLVIGAAGVMYFAEFFVDKIPGLDSSWDAIHTFIRIPAGAMLAMGAVGDASPALDISAAILGGGMAATSHATKAGTRLAVNASPEPFTNWGLSISEDIAVFGGLWAALNHPYIFIGLMILFLILAIWLLPKIWRAVKFIFRKIGELLGLVSKEEPLQDDVLPVPPNVTADMGAAVATPGVGSQQNAPDGTDAARPPVQEKGASEEKVSSGANVAEEISRLKKLLDEGAISEDEFNTLKQRLINGPA